MGCKGQEEGSLCSFSAFMIPGNCKLQTFFSSVDAISSKGTFCAFLGCQCLASFFILRLVTTHLPPNFHIPVGCHPGRSKLFPLSLTLNSSLLNHQATPIQAFQQAGLPTPSFGFFAKIIVLLLIFVHLTRHHITSQHNEAHPLH